MDDNQLDDMLREWADGKLPNENKRDDVLHSVFDHEKAIAEKRIRAWPTYRNAWAPALSALGIIVVLFLFVVSLTHQTPLPEPPVEIVTDRNDPRFEATGEKPLYVSILVLRRIPGSESEVEFLEDAVVVAENEKLHEIEIGGHRLFLWVYPLENALFTFDVGIDKAAETGLVAVPDRTQALQLQSNGDRFDVFVSVM